MKNVISTCLSSICLQTGFQLGTSIRLNRSKGGTIFHSNGTKINTNARKVETNARKVTNSTNSTGNAAAPEEGRRKGAPAFEGENFPEVIIEVEEVPDDSSTISALAPLTRSSDTDIVQLQMRVGDELNSKKSYSIFGQTYTTGEHVRYWSISSNHWIECTIEPYTRDDNDDSFELIPRGATVPIWNSFNGEGSESSPNGEFFQWEFFQLQDRLKKKWLDELSEKEFEEAKAKVVVTELSFSEKRKTKLTDKAKFRKVLDSYSKPFEYMSKKNRAVEEIKYKLLSKKDRYSSKRSAMELAKNLKKRQHEQELDREKANGYNTHYGLKNLRLPEFVRKTEGEDLPQSYVFEKEPRYCLADVELPNGQNVIVNYAEERKSFFIKNGAQIRYEQDYGTFGFHPAKVLHVRPDGLIDIVYKENIVQHEDADGCSGNFIDVSREFVKTVDPRTVHPFDVIEKAKSLSKTKPYQI